MTPSKALQTLRDFIQACADMPDVTPVGFDIHEALDKLEDCVGSYESQHDCYACEECDEAYNNQEQLDAHMRTHDEDAEPHEDDITTTDHEKFYISGKFAFMVKEVESEQGRYILTDKRGAMIGFKLFDTIELAISAFMEHDKYWPNCWFISDHGNAHRMTIGAEV